MNSNSPPKYDMRINTPYQVDWGHVAAGKKVAATKRKLRFKFGFSNADALQRGLTGIEARGEEHEVVLIWSLTSGKQVVIADGQQVHFSMGRRADTKFETSWTMAGQHNMKIIAHAAPPIRDIPGFKQYDLLLDGMSFFDMPRIYELGVKKGPIRRSHHGFATAVEPEQHGFAYKNYRMEEEHQYASRRYDEDYSMRSYPSVESGPTRRSTMEPISTPSPPSKPTPEYNVAPVQDVSSSQSPRGPDLLEAPASMPATTTMDEFAPVEAPPPSFQDVTNHILSAYPPAPTSPAPLALANESHTYHQPAQPPQQMQLQTQTQMQQYYNNGYPPQQQQTPYQQNYYSGAPTTMVSPDGSMAATTGHFFYQQPDQQQQLSAVHPQTPRPEEQPQQQPPVVTPTMMKPLEVDELRDSPPPVNEMDKAVQSLVNLNDINETFATPEQIKARKQKESNSKQQSKSRPAPPKASTNHIGQNVSLADIQQNKTPAAPAKEIMRNHAFDPAAAQAGMLVVYGQQQQGPSQLQPQYMSGIPAVNGFGAGAYNGYQWYQQQPMRSAY